MIAHILFHLTIEKKLNVSTLVSLLDPAIFLLEEKQIVIERFERACVKETMMLLHCI